jgi:hypothetical protein
LAYHKKETCMADTIPGGAFLTSSGQWVNADGKPLDKAQIAEAERLDAERNAGLRAAEQAKMAALAQRDPAAMAIANALRPPAAPAPKAKAE